MTDPISGKIASQMAQQANQAGEQADAVNESSSTQQSSFKDVLSNVQNRQVDGAQAAEGVDGPQKAQAVDAVDQAQQAEGPAQTRLREFLDNMSTDETKLDKMMSQSLSGAEMSQQDLLQMQALIYSYSQKVELATKAVSNAAGGMKQIMNTQV